MSWVITAIAVSAAAGAYQNNRVAKAQDRIAAQGIKTQAANQRKINQRVNNEIESIGRSSPDSARQVAGQQYIDQIRRVMGNANQGLAVKGLSSDFDQLAGESAANANDYAGTIAGLMSRIDAGTGQRRAESNSFGNLGMDLDVFGKQVQGDQYLNNLLLRGVRRDPYLDVAAGAASGWATGKAAGG
jgi:hypothetical protein